MSAATRVLVVHNRYRIEGGEERSVELQRAALAAAGIEHALFERSSADAGRVQAARALLRGGEREDELAAAVRALATGAPGDSDVPGGGSDPGGASGDPVVRERASGDSAPVVVHAHNTLPLIGPGGLAAARAAGAAVVLHLHNVRIFCATGFGERDAAPCRRCRGRNTLPGLALNCRRSLPEAAVYATALARHQPRLLAAVDRFVAPSAAARDELAARGLPADRIEVLRHYLPAAAFAERSRAGEGAYALVASRLSPEKGIEDALLACARVGVPLRIAGEGPERERLERRAAELGAEATFLGRLDAAAVQAERAGAAMVLMPSRYHEFSPYSALEAMSQGVPVVATALGGLPELLGAGTEASAGGAGTEASADGGCLAPGDLDGLAARVGELWASPALRAERGAALLARARERHALERHVEGLRDLYARVLDLRFDAGTNSLTTDYRGS